MRSVFLSPTLTLCRYSLLLSLANIVHDTMTELHHLRLISCRRLMMHDRRSNRQRRLNLKKENIPLSLLSPSWDLLSFPWPSISGTSEMTILRIVSLTNRKPLLHPHHQRKKDFLEKNRFFCQFLNGKIWKENYVFAA